MVGQQLYSNLTNTLKTRFGFIHNYSSTNFTMIQTSYWIRIQEGKIEEEKNQKNSGKLLIIVIYLVEKKLIKILNSKLFKGIITKFKVTLQFCKGGSGSALIQIHIEKKRWIRISKK